MCAWHGENVAGQSRTGYQVNS